MGVLWPQLSKVLKLGRWARRVLIVQELCESRGGRPGLSVLTSLLLSVDESYTEPCFGNTIYRKRLAVRSTSRNEEELGCARVRKSLAV